MICGYIDNPILFDWRNRAGNHSAHGKTPYGVIAGQGAATLQYGISHRSSMDADIHYFDYTGQKNPPWPEPGKSR
jgi:hypothetical protein